MQGSATFSPCRRYRYALWRRWRGSLPLVPGSYVMFLCLNPSTADATQDDPTVRRCIGFARAWEFDALCVANLFAFRATKPAEMMAQDDPIGPDNDRMLQDLAQGASMIIAAWGTHGAYRHRADEVRRMLPHRLYYLRLTKAGQPRHPLYLPYDLVARPWDTPGAERA